MRNKTFMKEVVVVIKKILKIIKHGEVLQIEF
jgi:hypothetical protein